MTQKDQRNILTGSIKMDESYVGGKPRKATKDDESCDRHKFGRRIKKTPVVATVERGYFIIRTDHG